MQQVPPIGGTADAPAATPSTLQNSATAAFGLEFESLLQIILTQLTYQDPLKPVENFEFVSQLAQFSQIQQSQTMSDRLLALLQSQATVQATSLLGRVVDIPSGAGFLTGEVKSISFQNGEPRLTLETADGRLISNIGLQSITQIRETTP